MERMCVLHQAAWNAKLSSNETTALTQQLEQGKIIFLPALTFNLANQEQLLLDGLLVKSGTKNVSYDPKTQQLKGLEKLTQEKVLIRNLMQRYYELSHQLITTLFPYYIDNLTVGRTSLRPIEIAGRAAASYRKDDTRLHVDSFPATPVQGQRILRIFCNINPHGKTRTWRLGEPFNHVVEQFFPYLSSPLPTTRRLLKWCHITKSYRTLYDHFMLQLHNSMKANLEYQQKASQITYDFPAGSTWIAYTDTVSHAATQGQHLLEQTFYLPTKHMQNPQYSPLAILEKKLARDLLV